MSTVTPGTRPNTDSDDRVRPDYVAGSIALTVLAVTATLYITGVADAMLLGALRGIGSLAAFATGIAYVCVRLDRAERQHAETARQVRAVAGRLTDVEEQTAQIGGLRKAVDLVAQGLARPHAGPGRSRSQPRPPKKRLPPSPAGLDERAIEAAKRIQRRLGEQ
ncbi:MAG TPA: hypothetical protein VFM54_09290 [Micromonosporaceae bacterium]|nr:hypothetical protein [Micromonosporaceae bacterium]